MPVWNGSNRPRMSFKERIIRFMSGRNGPDKLYNFLVYVCLGLVIINFFVQSYIISLLYALLFCYSVFRFMSRNLYKRRTENAKFLKISAKLISPFKLMRAKWKDRKTHVYKKCAHCKKVLRLPKKKGEHTVNCPVCHRKFNVKI